MSNINKFNFSPIKKGSSEIRPQSGGELYRERVLFSGIITRMESSSQTLIYSEGNPLPESFKIDGVDLSTRLPFSYPHINPKELTYSVKIKSLEGVYYFYTLVSAINSDESTSLLKLEGVLNTSSRFIGASFDILMPVDDGVRFVGKVSSIPADTTMVSAGPLEFSGVEFIEADPTNFEAFILRDGEIIGKNSLISVVSYSDNSSSIPSLVLRTVDPHTALEGDLIFVKSSKWSGFCNPMGGAEEKLDLVGDIEFFDTSSPDFVQSPMFDYELNHSTGSFQWFGNWAKGLIASSKVSIGTHFLPYNQSFNSIGVKVKNASPTIPSKHYTLKPEFRVINPSSSSLATLEVSCNGTTSSVFISINNSNPEETIGGFPVVFNSLSTGTYTIVINVPDLGESFSISVSISEDNSFATLEGLTKYFRDQSSERYSNPLSFFRSGLVNSVVSSDGAISLSPSSVPFYVNIEGETYFINEEITISDLTPDSIYTLKVFIYNFTTYANSFSFRIFLGQGEFNTSYVEGSPVLGDKFVFTNQGYDSPSDEKVFSLDPASILVREDQSFFSTCLPNIPNNLTLSAVAEGSVSYISKEQADLLKSGNASTLHHHNSTHLLKAETESLISETASSIDHDSLQGIQTTSNNSGGEFLHASVSDVEKWNETKEKITNLENDLYYYFSNDVSPNPEPPQSDPSSVIFNNPLVPIQYVPELYYDAACAIPLGAETLSQSRHIEGGNTLFVTVATHGPEEFGDVTGYEYPYVYVKLPTTGISIDYGMRSGGSGGWGGASGNTVIKIIEEWTSQASGFTFEGRSSIWDGGTLIHSSGATVVSDYSSFPTDYIEDMVVYFRMTSTGTFTNTSEILKIGVGFGGRGSNGQDGSSTDGGYGGYGAVYNHLGVPSTIHPWGGTASGYYTPQGGEGQSVGGVAGGFGGGTTIFWEDNSGNVITYQEGHPLEGQAIECFLDINNTFATKDLTGFGVPGGPGYGSSSSTDGGAGGGGGSCGIVYISWDPADLLLPGIPEGQPEELTIGKLFPTEVSDVYMAITKTGVCSVNLSNPVSPVVLFYLPLDTSAFSSGFNELRSEGHYFSAEKVFLVITEGTAFSINCSDKSSLSLNTSRSLIGGEAYGLAVVGLTSFYVMHNSAPYIYPISDLSTDIWLDSGVRIAPIFSLGLETTRANRVPDSIGAVNGDLFIGDYGLETSDESSTKFICLKADGVIHDLTSTLNTSLGDLIPVPFQPYLVSVRNSKIKVIDVSNPLSPSLVVEKSLVMETGDVLLEQPMAYTFTPNGKTLVLGGNDGKLWVINLTTITNPFVSKTRIITSSGTITSVLFSSDASYLFIKIQPSDRLDYNSPFLGSLITLNFNSI